MAICLAGATLSGQSTRTIQNERHGFRLVVPRFLVEVPPGPDEEQIIGKYKGTKRIKGKFRSRDGKRVDHAELPLEIWVFHIANPKSAGGAGPVTKSGTARDRGAVTPPTGDIKEQARRYKNGGRTVRDFLERRVGAMASRTVVEKAMNPPVRNRDQETFKVLSQTPQESILVFTVEHRHPHHGQELFGMVALCPRMKLCDKEVLAAARSLQRTAPKEGAAKADPYEGSKLRDLKRRREVRARLVDGWYAEDTENFIVITDMPFSSRNRQLMLDMLVDLETMRKAYSERFPPAAPFDVVSTVRVCNSYDGYIRYSSKPGTGGYWHPIAEELVLFNPVGDIRKFDWMRKVSPKAILYHEAMHQYFHYANGEMPPASWFNEGYGEYFGAAKTDRFEKVIRTIGKNEFRWQEVKRAKKEGTWPQLKKLLAMNQRQFYSRTSKDYPVLKNYAFGWAFCYFLELERRKPIKERNKLWAGIPDRYLKNLRAAAEEYRDKLPAGAPKGSLMRFVDPVQKRAYEVTFKGLDWDALQEAWVAAMKSW
ncbi:MAG: DUF1570 domain-containing protein [Planctomycetes bacterium]|nr:DUF1570 domain-containing protein [Planctomycetota bacterium]